MTANRERTAVGKRFTTSLGLAVNRKFAWVTNNAFPTAAVEDQSGASALAAKRA
jgi:hypothetical protein